MVDAAAGNTGAPHVADKHQGKGEGSCTAGCNLTDGARLSAPPQYFSIVGYSRSKMSDEEFRDLISENLTCRVTSGEDCGREMEEYLDRCTYVAVRIKIFRVWGCTLLSVLGLCCCAAACKVMHHLQVALDLGRKCPAYVAFLPFFEERSQSQRRGSRQGTLAAHTKPL
jgi:Glucose-6-phosphate dehydrogenase, NAD binding domain